MASESKISKVKASKDPLDSRRDKEGQLTDTLDLLAMVMEHRGCREPGMERNHCSYKARG